MRSFLISLATTVGLAVALPTKPSLPDLSDLTHSGTPATTDVPNVTDLILPQTNLASNQAPYGQEEPPANDEMKTGEQSTKDDSNNDNNPFPSLDSSFMGAGLGNTIDLGDLEHLPKATTNLLVGSTQVFNGQENEALPNLGGEDSDSDDEDSDSDSDDEDDSNNDNNPIPSLDSSFMGAGLGNTIDLGDLEHLPKATTNLLVGSTQVFNGQENEALPNLGGEETA